MTNNLNIVKDSTINIPNSNNFIQPVENINVETYLNQNDNSKLLVLRLDDLNASIINQLKESKCGMVVLNNNFKIVEKQKRVQHIKAVINGVKQLVDIENIIRFEAAGNYTNIYIKNIAKPVLTSKTLKYYANLFDETSFIRPHSKHLVHLKFVLNIDSKNTLCLINETALPISRRRFSYIKQVLGGSLK